MTAAATATFAVFVFIREIVAVVIHAVADLDATGATAAFIDQVIAVVVDKVVADLRARCPGRAGVNAGGADAGRGAFADSADRREPEQLAWYRAWSGPWPSTR